jgi:hypothetical protein
MKNTKRAAYVARDSIVNLLTDDEVAQVSTAESEIRLADGDEYVDLEQLDRGIQRATDGTAALGHLISRKAVQESTWDKILLALPRPF